MVSTVQPLFKNKSFKFAISLAMADSAAGTVCSIYGYSIILSNYPAHALIYYIVLQTLCTAMLRAVGLRFLAKNHKKNALTQYGIFIVIFIIGIILMQFPSYATPFAVAVITSGMTSLATIICWSMLSLSFGMREYKTVAKYCNQAAYLSSIIFSFSVPLLVFFFSNNSLLIFVTLMMASCGLAIYQLPIHKEEKNLKGNKKNKPKSIKYALYYYMMICTVLVTTITGTSQYIMRLESASYFTHEELSSFFGYFSGITNCLGLLIATTSEQVLKRFGLQGLLYSVPLIALANSLVVIFSPGFWSIIALGSIRSIFGYSYGAYSTEITLNILPATIRFITKANIKSTANIVSMLLLVVFTIGKTSTYYLTWWIPPLCLFALFFAYKVKQYYKITLQQESAFKRFNILEEITPATKPILKDIALNSIKEKDTYTVFYGLDLVNKLYVNEPPPKEVYSLLEHVNPIVRYEFINFISTKNTPKALPFLIEQLPKEPDKEIQRKLLEEIARLDLNAALKVSQNLANILFIPIIQSLYCILKPSNPKEALKHFTELSQSPNPVQRKMVASLIGTFKITQLYKCLKNLISDNDNTVSDEALRSAALIKDNSLIPEIVTALLKNKKNIIPQLTLRALGTTTIPYLLSEVFKIRQGKIIIKIIAAIPGKEAEEALITIVQQGTMYYRSIVAKYANKRACRLFTSDELKIKADQWMEEELSMIQSLHEKMKLSNAKQIQKEIKWRIILAKRLFIQWLAIATFPKEVNQLISSLLQNQKENDQVFDKAMELLELYIHDKTIHSYITYLFENKKLQLSHPLPTPYSDLWLEQIMTNTDQQSSLLSVVFELRSVRLFHDLPAEILLALAEDTQYYTFSEGEVIFAKDDPPDGLYCVSQGEVAIVRDENIVTTINTHGFFGELALLDEAPRVASAIAQNSCTLLFIEKDVFNRIADDVPDILRTVIKIILEYLRKNLERST